MSNPIPIVENVAPAEASSPPSGVKRKLRKEFTVSNENGTSHLAKHLKSCPRMKNKDVLQPLIFANKDIHDGTHAIKTFKFDQN
ncbi:hypothetical protein IFM89_015873 [Coptis chinensis]|uniref:Uncharacterized protein n=1 Tax=Coptis chinensis TaxID=261450 RepID=A0A835INQ8_9MAGN|nr:hypothetical protein IFM89_015873 [Coptis chinensis]